MSDKKDAINRFRHYHRGDDIRGAAGGNGVALLMARADGGLKLEGQGMTTGCVPNYDLPQGLYFWLDSLCLLRLNCGWLRGTVRTSSSDTGEE